jgi:hypothetical protein
MEKVTQLGVAWFLVFTEYELVDEIKEDEDEYQEYFQGVKAAAT